jgi:hypothetical protein
MCSTPNYKPGFSNIKITSEFINNYSEVKSSLSKYIIQKVYKYLEGIQLGYRTKRPDGWTAIQNSKDLFICKLFDDLISKDENLGKFVIPVISKVPLGFKVMIDYSFHNQNLIFP